MLCETQCLKRTQNRQELSSLVFYTAISLDIKYKCNLNVSLRAWHDHPSTVIAAQSYASFHFLS